MCLDGIYANQRHPGFLQFVASTGLPFAPLDKFEKQELETRGQLYRQIAERVWNPADLIAGVAP